MTLPNTRKQYARSLVYRKNEHTHTQQEEEYDICFAIFHGRTHHLLVIKPQYNFTLPPL